MSGEQASYKDKKVQVDETKAVCILLISDQKRYSLMLKKLRDRDNVGRDEYFFTTTFSLYPLIHTQGGIWGNQKLSTYKNRGGRG